MPEDPFALFPDSPKDTLEAGPQAAPAAGSNAAATLPQTSPNGGAEVVQAAAELVSQVAARGPENTESSEQAGAATDNSGYSAGAQASSPVATSDAAATLSHTSPTGSAEVVPAASEEVSQVEARAPAVEDETLTQAGPSAVPRCSGGGPTVRGFQTTNQWELGLRSISSPILRTEGSLLHMAVSERGRE